MKEQGFTPVSTHFAKISANFPTKSYARISANFYTASAEIYVSVKLSASANLDTPKSQPKSYLKTIQNLIVKEKLFAANKQLLYCATNF